jgi:hypothetical protein
MLLPVHLGPVSYAGRPPAGQDPPALLPVGYTRLTGIWSHRPGRRGQLSQRGAKVGSRGTKEFHCPLEGLPLAQGPEIEGGRERQIIQYVPASSARLVSRWK